MGHNHSQDSIKGDFRNTPWELQNVFNVIFLHGWDDGKDLSQFCLFHWGKIFTDFIHETPRHIFSTCWKCILRVDILIIKYAIDFYSVDSSHVGNVDFKAVHQIGIVRMERLTLK